MKSLLLLHFRFPSVVFAATPSSKFYHYLTCGRDRLCRWHHLVFRQHQPIYAVRPKPFLGPETLVAKSCRNFVSRFLRRKVQVVQDRVHSCGYGSLQQLVERSSVVTHNGSP